MKVLNHSDGRSAQTEGESEPSPLLPLVLGRAANPDSSASAGGVIVGELIGMADGGVWPLVVYPGQDGSAAIRARSVVDLHSAHIGKQVVLVLDGGDPAKPIVIGVLREGLSSVSNDPGHFEVDSDGERMIVAAKSQLVLRCGKASVTLTSAGKVMIEGSYVVSRSTGVNRIKGGSVQLN